MFEKLELTRMAQALAAHAGTRMGVIAENVANSDTPGFKARDIGDFASIYAAKDEGMRATRPGHSLPPDRVAAARAFESGGPKRPTATPFPWKRKW